MDRTSSGADAHAAADKPAAGTTLSQHVFANPADFLETLKTDFYKISEGRDNITREDLVAYSKDGTDPKGRAAASIAANHWLDMANLDSVPNAIGKVATKGKIYANDLDTDEAFYQNKLLGSQAVAVGADVIPVALMSGAAAASAFGAAITFETGVGPAVLIPTALGFGAIAGTGLYDMATAPGQIQKTADASRAKLNSWIR